MCNAFTGYLISGIFKDSVPNIRCSKYVFSLDRKIVSKKTIAAIFFGFYESAEIKFIEKYLDKNLSVIEFGSSLGIVSSHIIGKLSQNNKFIMVEANPMLTSIIQKNIDKNLRHEIKYAILNNAISYGSETVFLHEANDNTDTTVSKKSLTSNGISVRSITLGSILREFDISDYAIVCDIEGSEIEWLMNEDTTINNCRQLIIELHETENDRLHTVENLKDIIIKKHKFEFIDNIGPVYYFKK